MQSCEREASSQALAPPKVKKARLEASASSEEPAPRARKNIRWGKGKPGVRPPTVPPPPPRDPGKFEVPRPRPERSPMESRSENEPAIAAAVPEPVPARPKSPAPRAPQAPVQPVASRPTVVTGRQTRSKPIPGRLEDVLSAPETLAATGGYDWEKGRYITKHEQLRAPSSNPRPERRQTASPSPPPSPRRRRRRSSVIVAPAPMPSASPVASTSSLPPPVAKKARRSDSPGAAKPASRRRVTLSPVASASRLPVPSASAPPAPAAVPPEGRRATRRSFPIAGGLKDVIYSSSALAATGGWDEESGRCESVRGLSRLHRETETDVALRLARRRRRCCFPTGRRRQRVLFIGVEFEPRCPKTSELDDPTRKEHYGAFTVTLGSLPAREINCVSRGRSAARRHSRRRSGALDSSLESDQSETRAARLLVGSRRMGPREGQIRLASCGAQSRPSERRSVPVTRCPLCHCPR